MVQIDSGVIYAYDEDDMTFAIGEHIHTRVPNVGESALYYAYGTPGGEFPAGVGRAAIITEIDEPGNPYSTVGLCVLNPSGIFFNRGVLYTDAGKPGCWGWGATMQWTVTIPTEETETEVSVETADSGINLVVCTPKEGE